MAEIIDITKIPRKTCSNCKYGETNGVCSRPGGYRFDWKLFRCYSFQWKNPPKKNGRADL